MGLGGGGGGLENVICLPATTCQFSFCKLDVCMRLCASGKGQIGKCSKLLKLGPISKKIHQRGMSTL